ncbi:hypothetical protein HS125_04065 [bacterium]|nr:hypothetical protein [bacterium]
MQLFRIGLRLRSPVGTPLQADTLFGSLCWTLLESQGEAELGRFLEPFRAGAPPFAFSDGLPGDSLPLPLNVRLSLVRPLDVVLYRRLKELKQRRYVDRSSFRAIQAGGLPGQLVAERGFAEVSVLHARISRTTGHTGDPGSLHETVGHYPEDTDGRVTIFLAAKTEADARVAHRLLVELSHTGYGRKANSGMGHFEVGELTTERELSEVENPNALVTLSHLVPARTDPTDGLWQTDVKYGRLGRGVFENPFKRPLLRLTPGSVFRVDQPGVCALGRLLEGLAPGFPAAVHSGYALALPMRWHEDEAGRT